MAVEYNLQGTMFRHVGECCKRRIMWNDKRITVGCSLPLGHQGRHEAFGEPTQIIVAWDSEEDEAQEAMKIALGAWNGRV